MNIDLLINATRKAAPLLIRDYNELKHFKQSSKNIEGFLERSKLRTIETLTSELQKYFPEHLITSSQQPEQGSYILLDPLDSNTNLQHSLPFWGISVFVHTQEKQQQMLVTNFPCLDTILCAKKDVWIEDYQDSSKRKLRPSTGSDLIILDQINQNSLDFITSNNLNPANIRNFSSKAYSTFLFASGRVQHYLADNSNILYNKALDLISSNLGYFKTEHPKFNLYSIQSLKKRNLLSLKISA